MKKFHPAPKNARKTGKNGPVPGKKHFFKSPDAKSGAKPAGAKSAGRIAAEKFEQAEMAQNTRRPPRDDRPRRDARPQRDNRGPQEGRPVREARDNRPQRENRPPGLKLALYGQHAVTAAWLNPKRNIHALYVTPAQQDLAAILMKKAWDKGLQRPEPVLVDASRLEASLPQGAAHQGIALGSSPLFHPSLEDVLSNLDINAPATIVMLDQVTDPHNIGAILRSVAAFGGAAIVMQSRHAPEPSGVMGKTACGALDIVPLCYETNLSRSLDLLAEYGFVALGLDERGEKEIGDLPAAHRTVLVMGAEGDGLRRLVAEHCTHLVRLPTSPAMPSLNVSNAAAVALYALHQSHKG